MELAQGEKALRRIEGMAKVVWEEHYTPIIGAKQVAYMLDKFQSYASMLNQIETQKTRYYILVEQGMDLGYLSVRDEEDALFLSKIYILKNYRGLGWGKKALSFVESLALKEGKKCIRLTVNKNNTQSICVYKKSGFEQIDAVVVDIGGGFVMDDYVFEKELNRIGV